MLSRNVYRGQGEASAAAPLGLTSTGDASPVPAPAEGAPAPTTVSPGGTSGGAGTGSPAGGSGSEPGTSLAVPVEPHSSTPTSASTPTSTPTPTPTPTSTAAPETPSSTGTGSGTPTASGTGTGSGTPSGTASSTATPSGTGTASGTPSGTATASGTPSGTGTVTGTASPSPTTTPGLAVGKGLRVGDPAGLGLPPPGVPISSCTVPGTLAVTLGDGPAAHIAAALDAFAALPGGPASATWFLNGLSWDCVFDAPRVALMSRMLDAGHQLGSGGWSHTRLAGADNATLAAELTLTDDAFAATAGVRPAFARPPYGELDAAAQLALAGGVLPLVPVLWDCDPSDYLLGAVANASQASFNNALRSALDAAPGTIIVLHHTSAFTAGAVPVLAAHAAARGLRLATLGECLNLTQPAQWYRSIARPGERSPAWSCAAAGAGP